MTPDDDLARILRGLATVIAGAYIVGLVIGESARPLSAEPLSLAFYGATALVLAPFMLPRRLFAAAPSVLRAWMIAGAIVASVRAAFMAGWLFPRLPLASWLTKLLLDLVLLAALWAAARTTDRARSATDAHRYTQIKH